MEEEFHNHMRIPWHDYTRKSIGRPITEASLSEKASIIGRTGIMLLSCGTGAWRVRSSMNTLARELGITCTADIGLLSIEYTCIDGGNCYTESLCLFNTGVNTSKLYRMEEFVNKFAGNCKKSFILFLIGFMKFMVFILHHFLVWLPQLPAVHLLFYWAAALLKCFVHFWVPVPEIIFERR